MRKKILILEDDQVLAKTLGVGLASLGTKTTLVDTMARFYQEIEGDPADLCVMDRIIGNHDSVDAIDYIREIAPQAKILVLSKKSSVEDRLVGLESGADDYLAKPFSLAELRLRAKGLLKLYRDTQEEAGVFLGLVTFYPLRGTIETPEKKILLRKREMEILSCLARSLGTVVPRQTIISMLWPETYQPNPSTVDVYVRRLRQKLGKYQSILQTRRGFGYRLTPFQGETQANSSPFI